ncbi:MAG: MFS transporter [Solirubrobacteraceae bacterium]|nr:MFS transporter [Solirubrobacteraceae bacterium]
MTVRRHHVALAVALLLIAVNLRLPLVSVGPVLDDVREALGLSGSAAGALTTLPVLCFAAAGAAVPALARRVGPEAALLLGMLALCAGGALRIVPAIAPLYAGTLLAGAGIAVGNVLLPALIKREFAPPGLMMGLYVAVMSTGAAVATALTVPLERALGSWEAALAAWTVPAVVATVAWLPALVRARRGVPVPPLPKVRLRGDRLAWLLTGLFAFQSALFYALATWMPDLLRDAGLSDGRAGAMVAISMQLGLPGGLLAPIIAGRVTDQRVLAAGAAGLWAAGIAGVLVWPTTLTALWMALMGIAQGAGFALALALVVLRSPDGARATALSGMVQSLGYVVAAAAPLALGALHDLTGGWDAVLVAMLALSAAMLACGLGAGRPGTVGGRVDPAPQRAS